MVHPRTLRGVAAAAAAAAGLHLALLLLWPGGPVPHAGAAQSLAAAVTLVAVRPPPESTALPSPPRVDDAATPPVVTRGGSHRPSQPAASAAAAAPPVDLSAQPRSAPATATLQGLPFSGLPMRVRLTIDSTGQVVDVIVLRSLDDAAVNEAVRRMFLATAFVPARRGGVDVESVQDIELSLGDLR